MKYVRWVGALLIISLVLIIGGVVWSERIEKKRPIDVWLEKCIEKDSSMAGKLNCVIRAVDIEFNKCNIKDLPTAELLECLESSTKIWDKITDGKNIQKLTFIACDEKYKKYCDYVWRYWILKDISSSDLEIFNISKNNIFIIETDLNNDNHKDFIATVGNNDYFCGRFGLNCDFKVFIAKPKGGFDIIDSDIQIIPQIPVYIINDKVNGLKRLVINGRFIIEFDGYKTFRSRQQN